MNAEELMKYPYAVFDLDGTLVDSMPYWRRLGRDYLASQGIEAEDDLEASIRSMTIRESAQYFKEHYHLAQTAEKIMQGFEDVMEENYRLRIPAKPGVREYLKQLHAAGIDISICSATAVRLVEQILSRLELLPYFSHITSCEEVGCGKYRPDVFHLALRKLGAAPEETVMYEDADYAVRTAAKVGLHVAAVYDPYCAASPEEIRSMSEFYIQDYRNLLLP